MWISPFSHGRKKFRLVIYSLFQKISLQKTLNLKFSSAATIEGCMWDTDSRAGVQIVLTGPFCTVFFNTAWLMQRTISHPKKRPNDLCDCHKRSRTIGLIWAEVSNQNNPYVGMITNTLLQAHT